MTNITIKDGRVIDPCNQLDLMANVYIQQGKILAIGAEPPANFVPDLTLNAMDCIVAPGLVDLNANLFNSQINSANFVSQIETAVEAGITHLATTAFNRQRSLEADEIERFKYLSRAISKSKVFFIGALTQGLEGKRLNELKLLHDTGCIGFSNGSYPLSNMVVKKRCYDYAAMLGLKIFIRLEDPALSKLGCMHEGDISLRFGLPGIPVLSETISLAQELMLIEETGIQAHLYQLSAARTVELLGLFLERQLTVTSNVAIHQLFMTDAEVELDNGLCHVRPPFRTRKDLAALRQGLKQGSVTAICSDHLSLPKEAKYVPFQDSTPGIASWPLLLPLTLQLATEENLPLLEALRLITVNPAKVLGIDAGHLSLQSDANVIVFDPNETWMLSEKELQKFGLNNPFQQISLQGKLRYTLVDGQLRYKSDQ